MAKQLLPPTESKLMVKIDLAIALISIGVIVTCAITLAVLSTLPKNSLPSEYGYGSRVGYGYGYGATTELPANPTATEALPPSSTTASLPESDPNDVIIRQY